MRPGANAHREATGPQSLGQIRSATARASAVRNTPARNAHVVTARHPPTTDVGLSHDLIGSPYPPAGTRPEAITPATVPRKNGVMTEEPAKIAPKNLA